MQIRALPNEARYALPQVGRHPSEREVAIPSERVVVISRNDWSSSIGMPEASNWSRVTVRHPNLARDQFEAGLNEDA